MGRNTSYTLYATARADATYQNIWAFADAVERDTWLGTCTPLSFLKNKYWRVGAAIKCPISYEESYKYDYVRIVNADLDIFPNEWYCFITSRDYISNNVTQFTLDVDIVQTFYFSTGLDGGFYPFWQVNGFLESATLESTLPPRGTEAEYPVPERSCYSFYNLASDLGYYVAIFSTVDLRDLSNLTYISLTGDNTYTACPPYIMPLNASLMNDLIAQINTAGVTDAIAAIYLVPAALINVANVGTTPTLWGASLQNNKVFTISRPTSCDGYIPDNKVLLGYDYSYIVLNNGQGETVEYSFEDFDGEPEFAVSLTMASGMPCINIAPNNYKVGLSDDRINRITKVTQAPQCAYLNDSYRIWLAQTQNSREAAASSASMEVLFAQQAREKSTYPLLESGSSILSGTLGKTIGKYINIGSLTNAQSIYDAADWKSGFWTNIANFGIPGLTEYALTTAHNINVEAAQKAGIARQNIPQAQSEAERLVKRGILNYLGAQESYTYSQNVMRAQQNTKALWAGYADKARVPATTKGSNIYGDMTPFKQYGFSLAVYTPTAEYAKIIDEQMKANGHIVNTAVTGSIIKMHPIFDYYKFSTCFVPSERSGRPQWARNMLMDLLMNGVYLWYVHDGDIDPRIGCTYGIDNSNG